MSRPRSAQVPAVSDAFLYCSDAALPRLRACSPIAPRSSEPAFGASSMPRPAPSTVPVSRPIMNPALLLPSLSYRSKLSAMVLLSLVKFEVRSVRFEPPLCVLRAPAVMKEPVDRGACGVHEREHAIDARRHGGGGAPNRRVDALGAGGHPRRAILHV